ncbi:hypothetical protein ES703_113084 [subsurface metagenome]
MPSHNILKNMANFFKSFVLIYDIYLRTQSNTFRYKKFCISLIPGLVIIAVEMNSVTLYSQFCLLTIPYRRLLDILNIRRGISRDKNFIRITKLHIVGDEPVETGVLYPAEFPVVFLP